MSNLPAMSRVEAIPPDDYTGTMADWCCALIRRGYKEAYYEVLLTLEEYNEILEECEGDE